MKKVISVVVLVVLMASLYIFAQGSAGTGATSAGIVSAGTGESIVVNLITEQEMGVIVKRSKLLNILPKDAKFAISFFAKDGRNLPGYGFTIDGQGNVKKGYSDYEVMIGIGEYRIPELKQTQEICDAFQHFYDLQDIRIELGSIGKLKAVYKYRKMTDCVKFKIL